jgi:hypothetical protein
MKPHATGHVHGGTGPLWRSEFGASRFALRSSAPADASISNGPRPHAPTTREKRGPQDRAPKSGKAAPKSGEAAPKSGKAAPNAVQTALKYFASGW